ncbi:MAG: hypothetical protein IK094_09390 [Treponema sp.]|nr:hypothetical protein [Treponema sp.]
MRFFKLCAAALFLFLAPLCLFAEFYSSSYYGWNLDLPEGFLIKDSSDDGLSFYLEHEFMKVRVAIKMFAADKYERSDLAMEDVLNKLGADGEIDGFLWNGRHASVAQYEFQLPGNATAQAGWGISVTTEQKPVHLVVLCYTDKNVANDCQQFILSALDSLCLNKKDFRLPGLITAYAFSSEEVQSIAINIGEKKIYARLPAQAKESGRFVIDREFSVLTLYAKQKQWKEAWQRYYRLIFREAYSRLDAAAQSIYAALSSEALTKNPKNPNVEICKKLLAWTQDFDYQRKQDTSDFNDLSSVLQNLGSDCDSRALLLCVLMEHYGVKTELFISGIYSHALFGVDLPYPGARIMVDGTNYLLCETTAPVDMGLVAKEQSETKNWISVDLP